MSLEGKTQEEIAALAELALQISSNPKTRAGFLNLSKQNNPDASIPEVDIPIQVNKMMEAGLTRLAAAEKEVNDMKTERAILAKREALLSNPEITKLGVERSDLPAIEKLMVEKHIPDHETAAEFYALQQRAAEPTPGSVRPSVRESTMPTIDMKSMGANTLAEHARRVAAQTLDAMRKGGQIRI
jgi:hypothetical protein